MECAYNFLLHELGISNGDSVVVACSGGPDSMALLSLLIDIRKRVDISIICAHVNHNVRDESETERVFVSNFCLLHDVIFEYMKIDNYSSFNFESEARAKRYNFFDEIVKKYGAKYLFTAHHGDDLMETILMRMVRGSTLGGYSGFSKMVDKGDYKIVRPLIHMTKDEILSYNDSHDIKYVIDKTNFLDIHTRNRFRKNVLPFLKNEDVNVHHKFYKFSKMLLEYSDYIDSVVDGCIDNVLVDNVLMIDEFLKLEHVIGMKIIYIMLGRIYKDNLMFVNDRHTEIIYNLICSSRANAVVCLPNNVSAVKSYNNLMLVDDADYPCDYNFEFNDYVNLPNGKNIAKVDDISLTSNNVIRLSGDDVLFPLRVRTRKNGDRIYLKGMNGSKKVKDIFIDLKIPAYLRDGWPIVVDANDVIVWIPGLKKSKFDRQKGEKCDIILKYY